jgi:hypothetical protein
LNGAVNDVASLQRFLKRATNEKEKYEALLNRALADKIRLESNIEPTPDIVEEELKQYLRCGACEYTVFDHRNVAQIGAVISFTIA